MNIALFGGTFDPIHAGHLQVAKAAARKFGLERILLVVSGNPPHKLRHRLAPFAHRYSMVALACAGDPLLVPSMLEAPAADGRPQYSISTVRKVKQFLGSRDHLYFLIGADAFLDLPHWKEYRRLLASVDFIVVSRPGSSSRQIRRILLPDSPLREAPGTPAETIRPIRAAVHILPGVHAPVASRQIREAVRAGRRVAGLVPPLVEEYLMKVGLYRPGQPELTKR